jgi:hypothetical protein
MADRLEIVSLVPLSTRAREEIEANEPSNQQTSAEGWFDGE